MPQLADLVNGMHLHASYINERYAENYLWADDVDGGGHNCKNLGNVGIGTEAAWKVECHDDVSSWPALTGLHDGARFVVGGYLESQEFAGGSSPVVQALVGACKIPSTAPVGFQGTGVAGYAITDTANLPAVGVFGYGQAAVADSIAFGGNFSCSDAPSGGSGRTIYGIEVDVNVYDATSSAIAIWINGGGQAGVTPAASEGMRIGFVHDDDDPDQRIPYNYGINIIDGSSNIGIGLGLVGNSGNSRTSQPIYLRSKDSGGTERTATIHANVDGNVLIGPKIGVAIDPAGSGTGTLFAAGNTFRPVNATRGISSGSDPGEVGEICFDTVYVYFYVGGSWRRIAHSAF
jgi:hypothetical protein